MASSGRSMRVIDDVYGAGEGAGSATGRTFVTQGFSIGHMADAIHHGFRITADYRGAALERARARAAATSWPPAGLKLGPLFSSRRYCQSENRKI